MKLLKLRFFYFVCLLCTLSAWAQDVTQVTGTITDEAGMPVPGATVMEKGTQNGTSTDLDGKFTINVGAMAVLQVSYIGYTSQEILVNGQTTITISLVPGAEQLEEVVVVGYGTQKKSVVTGAISRVTAKQLENVPLTRIEQSLQGRTSGVTIFANAGAPGSSSTVRIRGVASFNAGDGANDPLWVVDGIVLDNGGIGYINQADIESIEVLKDAASAAIYGTRGATGVILITTKKGKAGKISVNYNGFAGFSGPARKLDLLNANQYATLRNEQYANGFQGGTFQLPYPNAATLGNGTNWQDQIFNDHAMRSQHEVSVSGGNDKSTFYMSFGLTDQDGIVTSDISHYTRKNLRLNSDHKVAKWLKIGQTFSYAHAKTLPVGNTNGEYGGPLASAINLDPTTPAIVTDPSTTPNSSDYANQFALKDANGNYYGISNSVQQEMTNPLAYVATRLGNYDWSDDFVGNAYMEISPIDGLKFRSTIGGKMAYWGSESFTPQSYLGPNSNTSRNNLYRSTNQNMRYTFENTLSYSKMVNYHNFTVLLGQGAYVDDIGSGTTVRYYNQPTNDWRDASFAWSTAAADITASAYTNQKHTIASLFARVNYDYKEKYLFTGVIRRDGSSHFGANNKYGNFPSFSLGWVPTKEDFWKENKILNQLKLRGGFGVTGNDYIRNNSFLSLIGGGYNYTIGNGGAVTIGNTLLYPSNKDIAWEETSQTNIGFDAVMLGDFSLTVEWYKKKTSGILMDVPLPGYVGAGIPRGNVGEMKNTGWEFELGYRKKVGDLNITVNGNLSTLKNTVTNVGRGRDFLSGPSIQSSQYPLTRSEPGGSYNAFYGFVTDGIFQNQAEIDAAAKPADITVVPGDFRYKDLDGNGVIDEKDRTYIGNPLPDITYGLTINLEYKGFDLMMFGQGVAGNQIYQGVRRLDMINANWQTNALNRWTGEGTSNSYPRLSTLDPNGNFSRPSTFQIQDGDYFRIKVIQFGYSLPESIIGKTLSRARLYVTAENLFTFTKYTGYDPEIGGDVMGIDRGYYPQARSFMIGCNLSL